MELGLVIASLIVGSISLCFSMAAVIMVMAKDKATHTVQMIPVDEEIDRANDEFLNQWATSDKAIKKDKELYKEEIEDEMPEFSLSDDDKEIFSL